MMRARSGVVSARTRFLLGFAAFSTLATLVALPGEPALANRMVGTNGADRIVGTAKPDQINARRGKDRVNGRQGADRISGSRGEDRIRGAQGEDGLAGGKGADHLNAVDGKKDRVVNGGPGRDVCTIDRADLPVLKGCEKTVTSAGGGGGRCTTGPPEAKRGTDGGPPNFSPAFYGITITLNASSDGAQGGQLPISIEEVCDFPKSVAKDAAKLAGGDAVAIVGPDTKVFKGGKLLQGQAATRALADLDSVSLRARLKPRGQWVRDEDGNPLPTFEASRITITD